MIKNVKIVITEAFNPIHAEISETLSGRGGGRNLPPS